MLDLVGCVLLPEVSVELLREWWILHGQDAGACQHVLQTYAGMMYEQVTYWLKKSSYIVPHDACLYTVL